MGFLGVQGKRIARTSRLYSLQLLEAWIDKSLNCQLLVHLLTIRFAVLSDLQLRYSEWNSSLLISMPSKSNWHLLSRNRRFVNSTPTRTEAIFFWIIFFIGKVCWIYFIGLLGGRYNKMQSGKMTIYYILLYVYEDFSFQIILVFFPLLD